MSEIHFHRRAAAPIDTVWEVLSDHRGMPGWSPLRSADLERQGDPAPNGVGAIRVLRAVGPAIREQVTHFEPPRRLEYTMLSGAPVRDYHARVDLSEAGLGTEIEWTVTFVPRFPGVQLVVRQVISGLIGGLTRTAEQRASAARPISGG
jgi:uncharacterized protein YndB with AHSA1/START domain